MDYTNRDIIPGEAKPIRWVGSALRDLTRFPRDVRREAGFELFSVQSGREPSDSKPMPSVGPGVREIRISPGTEHRVFYVARFAEAVYVLHVFEKRTQKTVARDLDLGRKRLAEVQRWRQQEGRR